MLRWGDLLDRLADDGVSLEAVETGVLSEEGEPLVQRFLLRWDGDRPLSYAVEFESRRDPVPKFEVRRIAIRLRLDPERYILPDDAL